MERATLERDLKEEMKFWIDIQNDANLRGGERDLIIANFAVRQRRKLQDELLNLWDGVDRRIVETSTFQYLNEKQPTGVGAGELVTNKTKLITRIVTRNGDERNEFIS